MKWDWVEKTLRAYDDYGSWTYWEDAGSPDLRLAFKPLTGKRREGRLPALYLVGPVEERIVFLKQLVEGVLGDASARRTAETQ